MNMDDLQEQIEQLRANRAKKHEEHDYDDFFEDDKPKKEKKPDGVMGVVTVQAIVCISIVIIYVLIMTFSKETCTNITSVVKDKLVNDFSFKEIVYETVGNAISYLNEKSPVNVEIQSDTTVSEDGSADDTSSTETNSDSTSSNEAESKEENSSQDSVSEIPSGAGGEPNPVKDNQVPSNATFAPVIYTGRITFPIEEGYRITSNFGFRDHPTNGVAEFHNALDIAAAKDTKIRAAADGVVAKSEENKILGKHIIIDHGNGFFTTYGHCDKLNVKAGARIREGEIIAKVGSTGVSTGYHLHFAMQKDGLYFNPAYIFAKETAGNE